MPIRLPSPQAAFPHHFASGEANPNLAHLAQVIDHPNIEIGAYTYANDFDPPARDGWAARLAPYTYPDCPERLVIGRFCQIAHGARFITASANHRMDGLTSYPAEIFNPDSLAEFKADWTGLPDTLIGHDVWIGHGALILPGARIGNGVIVGAGAVVSGTIPDYAIVAGNPAKLVRLRFPAAQVEQLNALQWWDWPAEEIANAWPILIRQDVTALTDFAAKR